MVPTQSTLKRTQADTTVPWNWKHPKSNIPHKTPKLAQLQADKNQQEQRSVDKVHNIWVSEALTNASKPCC